MARAFADMVNARLTEREWSLRSFAERVEPGYTPDAAVGYVSKILRGHARLRPAKFNRWADALRFDGADRERFMVLAWLARADEKVEAMFLGLESRVAELERVPGPKRAPPSG